MIIGITVLIGAPKKKLSLNASFIASPKPGSRNSKPSPPSRERPISQAHEAEKKRDYEEEEEEDKDEQVMDFGFG